MRLNDTLNLGAVAVTIGVNGAIGTAATTVDVSCFLPVTTTAALLNLTLPVPTLGNGQLVTIYNSGVNFFYIEGVAIRPQGTHQFIYFGGWRSASSMPVLQFTPLQFAGALTLTLAHHGYVLEYTGAAAVNITVPNTLLAGFQCSFTQAGTGIFTLVGSGGMVVSNRWNGFRSAGQWAKVGLEVRTVTSAVASGDLQV